MFRDYLNTLKKQKESTAQSKETYSIIGAGPVGLATALLLAKNGIPSIVYESRSEISNDLRESYPIGLNPRAFKTLDLIDPELSDKIRSTANIVDSWQIYGG